GTMADDMNDGICHYTLRGRLALGKLGDGGREIPAADERLGLNIRQWIMQNRPEEKLKPTGSSASRLFTRGEKENRVYMSQNAEYGDESDDEYRVEVGADGITRRYAKGVNIENIAFVDPKRTSDEMSKPVTGPEENLEKRRRVEEALPEPKGAAEVEMTDVPVVSPMNTQKDTPATNPTNAPKIVPQR